MSEPIRYRSAEEDSARWVDFPFRGGDVVISTRSKSGTTWMQRIISLLFLPDVDLPAPLGELSPWVDWLIEPYDALLARMDAQERRRFMKTHTPLDGVPIVDGVTYVVVCRHPLDLAVSLYHQGANLDRARIRELTGEPEPRVAASPRQPLHDWLLSWIDEDADPADQMDGLLGVLHHARDAWERADSGEGDVLLVHYADLQHDLATQMRRIAARLEVRVPDERWPALVEAASFDAMRDEASAMVPDGRGVLKDVGAFFRRGTSGAGAEVLTTDELAAYRSKVGALVPADVDAWLHRG